METTVTIYHIEYWDYENWSGDPKTISITLDHEPTTNDIERELQTVIDSFRVVSR